MGVVGGNFALKSPGGYERQATLTIKLKPQPELNIFMVVVN